MTVTAASGSEVRWPVLPAVDQAPVFSSAAELAGHRDTFFRPLRRVQAGDDIRLVTPRGTFQYRAARQVVVEPHELWVLDSSTAAALTLITCYPFNFVGPAPRRFVIHAERIVETSDSRQTGARHQGGGVP